MEVADANKVETAYRKMYGNMDNVWFSSIYDDWEEGVIKQLKVKGRWNKVIWPNPKNPETEFTDKNFHRDLRNAEYVSVDPLLYDKIYPHLFEFIDMYSRNSKWGQNVYDELNVHDYLNLFNLIINYYYHQFRKHEITLLVLLRSPHVGHDYLRYLVAKELGIRTLILEQSLIPNRFFHYFDHRDYGLFSTSKIISVESPVAIENKFEKKLFYMAKKKKSASVVLRQVLNYPFLKMIKELVSPDGRGQAIYRYQLKKAFIRNSKRYFNCNFDPDIPYVYFPLHLQPEKTTSSWGGMFNDQILAIERLADLVPDDWVIYVKENPKQSFFMRGRYFYERLGAIKKARLVPGETDTYQLLRNSKFVATITGTVGWEAITGGKNVLVFGWGVWYKTLPGVFEYSKDFRILDILNYAIDHSELERKFTQLKSKMGKGVIYKGDYRKIVESFSKEENVKTIAESVDRILYSESIMDS